LGTRSNRASRCGAAWWRSGGLEALARQVLSVRTASGAWRIDGQAVVEVNALWSPRPSLDAPPSHGLLLQPPRRPRAPESAAPGSVYDPGPCRGPRAPRQTWRGWPTRALAAAESGPCEPYPFPQPNAASTAFTSRPRPRTKRAGVHLLSPILLRLHARPQPLRVPRPKLGLVWRNFRRALARQRIAVVSGWPSSHRPRVASQGLRVPAPEAYGVGDGAAAARRLHFSPPRVTLPDPRARLRVLPHILPSGVALAVGLIVVGIGLWNGALPVAVTSLP
jgi:hypothetical protein